MDIPADAPRSEDGHYWWDGTQWQLIDQSQNGAQAQAGAATTTATTMTNDLFANMLQAAESDAREA